MISKTDSTPGSAKTRKKPCIIGRDDIKRTILEHTPIGQSAKEQLKRSNFAMRDIKISNDESLTLIQTDDNRPQAITATDDEDVLNQLRSTQRPLLAKHTFAE